MRKACYGVPPGRVRRLPASSGLAWLFARGALAMSVAVAVTATALVVAGGARLRAAGSQEKHKDNVAENASHPVLIIGSIRANLTSQEKRIRELAMIVLRDTEGPAKEPNDLINEKMAIQSAAIAAENAKLEREVAEIAVVEYVEGQFPQDVAVVDGERASAVSDRDRALENVKRSRDRLAKVRAASKGSTFDIVSEGNLEDRVEAAGLGVRRAEFAIKQADENKKILLDYIRGVRIKELQATVEKARADEMTRSASLALVRARSESQHEAKHKGRLTEAENRLLTLLGRALVIDEQVQSALRGVVQNGRAGDTALKEIQNLTNQLGQVVNDAETAAASVELEESAAQMSELKRRIERVLQQSSGSHPK
jgi:hypothetical protein